MSQATADEQELADLMDEAERAVNDSQALEDVFRRVPQRLKEEFDELFATLLRVKQAARQTRDQRKPC